MVVRRFARYPVAKLRSIAHLLPEADDRCGVYVLHFADGQRYVGQSRDVVSRFAAHRRRWSDIELVDFVRLSPDELNAAEADEVVAQERLGKVLRNVDLASHVVGERDVDDHIPVHEQLAWLNGDADLEDVPRRAVTSRELQAGSRAYERLQRTGALAVATDITAVYLELCVPRPRETEQVFWSLSASPATNRSRDEHRLCVVSVNRPETFVLSHVRTRDGDWVVGGFVVLSRAVLARHTSLSHIGGGDSLLTTRATRYASAGADQMGLDFVGYAGFAELISLPGAVPACREMVLRLMRKGPTFQWKSHCFPLANDVFDVMDGWGPDEDRRRV